MATETIGTCPGCESWASLRGGLCSTCRAAANLVVAGLTRRHLGRVAVMPIGLVASGLSLHARVLASAGFSAARIADMLGADEEYVRLLLEAR